MRPKLKPILDWAVACSRGTRGVRTDHSKLVREEPALTAGTNRLGSSRDRIARNNTARSSARSVGQNVSALRGRILAQHAVNQARRGRRRNGCGGASGAVRAQVHQVSRKTYTIRG